MEGFWPGRKIGGVREPWRAPRRKVKRREEMLLDRIIKGDERQINPKLKDVNVRKNVEGKIC